MFSNRIFPPDLKIRADISYMWSSPEVNSRYKLFMHLLVTFRRQRNTVTPPSVLLFMRETRKVFSSRRAVRGWFPCSVIEAVLLYDLLSNIPHLTNTYTEYSQLKLVIMHLLTTNYRYSRCQIITYFSSSTKLILAMRIEAQYKNNCDDKYAVGSGCIAN